MHLRPTPARWFETYVPREFTVGATEVLARTGVVQLELDPRVPSTVDSDKLRHFIERCRELIDAHRDDIPSGQRQPTALLGNPLHLANLALHRLRVWSARVDFVNEHLAQLRTDLDQLALLEEALEALHAEGLDLEGLPRHTRFLCKCLFACPRGCCSGEHDLSSIVHVVVHGSRHDFPLLVGLPQRGEIIKQQVLERGCEPVAIPEWLVGDHHQQLQAIRTYRTQIRSRIATLEDELQDLRTDPAIVEAHANIDTLGWYLDHAVRYLTEGDLCHVTGWTTTNDPHALQQALQDQDIPAIIRFPDPPAFAEGPAATLETWWSQPFRPLLLMWGAPGKQEIDPTGLLALIVPLLFGYMFGDVGHGLVLAAFALLFWRRWPQIHFLLPCGLAAVGFGFLFGDVFGFHGVIPALWLRPLDEPLMVLGVPLLFGVLLMLLALVFAGIEAYWQERLRRWVLADAAILILYAVLLTAIFFPAALWATPALVLYYLVGSWLLAEKEPLKALGVSVGELLLSVFELIMNTLSFVRLGAFALAHAALSFTVLSLAATVENPVGWLLIVVLGNLFVIVLEGLVVFVQTTRLVLFEFFIHFLRAEGRPFRPGSRPPANEA